MRLPQSAAAAEAGVKQMTPQQLDVLLDIVTRMRQAALQQRGREADVAAD